MNKSQQTCIWGDQCGECCAACEYYDPIDDDDIEPDTAAEFYAAWLDYINYEEEEDE